MRAFGSSWAHPIRHGLPAWRQAPTLAWGEQMDRSAEDGGAPPTAVAPGPAAPHPVAVPQQRSSSTGASSTGTSGASTTDSPPGPPGQQAAAPRRATDGVAVAALVSGIIPAIPVTLVLGPLALIRVGRS